MKFFTAFILILIASCATADLSKADLLNKVGKLEAAINETLKKVAGSALGIVDEAELLVLKTQMTLLKTLTETLNGLPIVGDLLLPTLEKTLTGIEGTVDATIKKIEKALLGATTSAKPPVKMTTAPPSLKKTTAPRSVKLTTGHTIKLIPSTIRLTPTARP